MRFLSMMIVLSAVLCATGAAASAAETDAARRAEIYKAQRFSDHAPLVMDYDL